MTTEQDGTGDYIAPPAATELGTEDFTVEGWIDEFRITAEGADLGKLVPNDGDWHSVGITRNGKRTFTHTQEKIKGVLYVVVSEYDSGGSLVERKYTRADLVRG